MSQIVMLHGATSRPERSWFPWLTWQLLRLQQDVFVPRLPQSDKPDLANWKQAVCSQVPKFHKDLILVGHSAGANLALHIMEEAVVPIKSLFLVAPFYRKLIKDEYNTAVEGLLKPDFNWELIKKQSSSIKVYHGDNDTFVPYEQGVEISKFLSVEINEVKNGGHLNTASGFLEFEQLLSDISSILSLK